MIEVIIRYLTQEDNDPNGVSFESAVLAGWLLIITCTIFSVTRHHAWLLVARLGNNIRTSITALIFKKVLRGEYHHMTW